MVQIEKSTMQFLSDLKKHNDREWFAANRKRYEDARNNFTAFIQEVINEITSFDPILKGLEAKSCIYRINRDIRFSNDKSPYKTHFGAFILRGGNKNMHAYAGYYIHIEPGNCMLSGGAYIPPTSWLSAIREKIDEQGDELLKISRNKDFIKYFGKIEGEKLKTAPKGYPKDHKFIELLKLKSFLATCLVTDEAATKKDYLSWVISGCRAMKPMIDFLNDY
jgi:TIGR02453 family protein